MKLGGSESFQPTLVLQGKNGQLVLIYFFNIHSNIYFHIIVYVGVQRLFSRGFFKKEL